ncbi:hypothetical protein Y1Q_0009536 [Alligator mississippiensis]|uniref:Uncharacterized protein n=1 Tax=Alligator mississippiensis TaxID=8496 RepID=A0A151NUR4_ALLMI|nr:hypothetical protein Y1Q_0009536 [Alligator mississippiensis]
MFLAKAEWVDEGEEWGRFFTLRVKRKMRVMGVVHTADGGRVEDVEGVLREDLDSWKDVLFHAAAGSCVKKIITWRNFSSG